MGEKAKDERPVGRETGAEDAKADFHREEVGGGDIAPGGVGAFERVGVAYTDDTYDALARGDEDEQSS